MYLDECCFYDLSKMIVKKTIATMYLDTEKDE